MVDEKMAICKSCGAPLEQGDRFCGECGQPVKEASGIGAKEAPRNGTPGAETEAGKEAQVQKRKTSLGVKVFVWALIILLMGFGAWAAYKWMIIERVSIDTSQLLPQDNAPAPAGPVQRRPNTDQPGKIVRGWLGLGAQDVSWDMANRIGMAAPSGALVSGCEPGGPADRAGILPGDVVLELDGVQVVNAADLRQKAAQQNPGRMVQLKIWREGSFYALSLLVGERPPDMERQKRKETRQYTAAYEACFAKFCPGCNSPLDLFKEQTPECRQCEASYKPQLDECAGR